MKHTECKDCELSIGDCGYRFKIDGKANYDIVALTDCDKYGNCMFFKQKAKPKGDLISREALKEKLNMVDILTIDDVINTIDSAPTVSDRYDEGYAQGYIDGSTGADWRGKEE